MKCRFNLEYRSCWNSLISETYTYCLIPLTLLYLYHCSINFIAKSEEEDSSVLGCSNSLCSHGLFFHLVCVGLQRHMVSWRIGGVVRSRRQQASQHFFSAAGTNPGSSWWSAHLIAALVLVCTTWVAWTWTTSLVIRNKRIIWILLAWQFIFSKSYKSANQMPKFLYFWDCHLPNVMDSSWYAINLKEAKWTNKLHWKLNTLRPRQFLYRIANDIFNCISLNENVWISNKISMKLVPTDPIEDDSALVQVMGWRGTGGKPLPDPMMTQLKSPGVNEWTQGPEIGHVVKTIVIHLKIPASRCN